MRTPHNHRFPVGTRVALKNQEQTKGTVTRNPGALIPFTVAVAWDDGMRCSQDTRTLTPTTED